MARLPDALKLALIACAGVTTFYATAQWSNRQKQGADDGAAVVEAVTPAREMVAAAPATLVERAPKPASGAAPTADADRLLSLADRARSIPKSDGDPFAALNWQPPEPPPPPVQVAVAPMAPVVVERPAPPAAPPLPYVFIGMLDRGDGKPEAFLAKGEALHVVAAGQLLDDQVWRVDALTPSEVLMTYVPLNQQQRLNISAGNR